MFDLLQEKLLKAFENHKVVCWNNGEIETTRIVKDKYMSFRVPYFITRLSYPPHAERDYSVSVYVHYIEHAVKKRIESESLVINNFKDYLRVYNDVIEVKGFGSEARRFYHNWVRRFEFRNSVLSGKKAKQ